MNLDNTIRVNTHLLSPASYELFEELNQQLEGGCPVTEICDFLHDTAWQDILNTAVRDAVPMPDELEMEVYEGNTMMGKA